MTWQVKSFISDTLDYLVSHQGDGRWVLYFNGQTIGDYPDQGTAVAAAEVINQANTIST